MGVLFVTLAICMTLGYKQSVLKAQGIEYACQLQELKKQKKQLKKDKEDLKEFKKYVKTDEYVEEIARDKLGLVYKDEIILNRKTVNRRDQFVYGLFFFLFWCRTILKSLQQL